MKLRNTLVALVFGMFAASSLASSSLEGRVAPDFALKSSTGDNMRLSEYRGDVVMINFWATWCGPCRQEMPLLDELYSRYNRVGFNLLGVNIDDDSRRAMQMVEELGVNFPVLFDARKAERWRDKIGVWFGRTGWRPADVEAVVLAQGGPHCETAQTMIEHGVAVDRGVRIQFPLTHEDLSFLTGSHRVTITKALKKLKKAGKINKEGRSYILSATIVSSDSTD